MPDSNTFISPAELASQLETMADSFRAYKVKAPSFGANSLI